jgi:hypothetical protein
VKPAAQVLVNEGKDGLTLSANENPRWTEEYKNQSMKTTFMSAEQQALLQKQQKVSEKIIGTLQLIIKEFNACYR